jgi:glutamyl endopeptidase
MSTVQSSSAANPSDLDTSISKNLITNEESYDAMPAVSEQQSISPAYQGSGKLHPQEIPILPSQQKPDITTHSIIGKDNRAQVKNTKSYPYSAIAFIELPKNYVCTGWFISPDTVVTAGHCVYDVSKKNGLKGWVPWAKIYPGRNGSSSPYGYADATYLYTVKGWTNSNDPKYDYGAIKINRPLGNQTGWFGYRWQSASLNGIGENIAGYPASKPQTMWQHSDKIRKNKDRQLGYQNDTEGGQSGSPVYEPNNSKCKGPCGIAIHAYGTGLYNDNHNYGTRITKDVFDNLSNWKNAKK